MQNTKRTGLLLLIMRQCIKTLKMKYSNKPFVHISQRIRIFLLMLTLLYSYSVYSQTEDPVITKLFQNSYKVMDAMRIKAPNVGAGIYLDALAINTGDKPVALAANGVGLISLCIADAMYKKTGDAVNWDANAEAKALQTINEWIRLKNTPGAVNKNGLFHRYLDPKDGSWVWVTEHSTIDNAIMAAGFLFCRNYFNQNTEIVSKTTELLNSMDFTAAISGGTMYMILDDNGARSVVANPFNEYIVLAWFAKNSNPSFAGYANAQTYWNNNFSDPAKLPKFSYPAGNPTLSEGSSNAQPSFHVQFAYYYCNYFMNNAGYMTYFKNQAVADRTWWKNNTTQQTAWGNGAGEIPGGGYSADAIYRNPDLIVSPHIIAGFSPVDGDVKKDLVALYSNGTGAAVYKIPGTNREFLWRYKYRKTTDRASYVQSVDFSTMLYGLAALPEYLGPDFFKKYNDFNFDPATSASAIESEQQILKVYPNPFSEKTTLLFELGKKARVKMDIYSEKGDLVRQLINEQMVAGRHTVTWDARNDQKIAVKKGSYFCRLTVDGIPLDAKQLLIVK